MKFDIAWFSFQFLINRYKVRILWVMNFACQNNIPIDIGQFKIRIVENNTHINSVICILKQNTVTRAFQWLNLIRGTLKELSLYYSLEKLQQHFFNNFTSTGEWNRNLIKFNFYFFEREIRFWIKLDEGIHLVDTWHTKIV